MKDWKGISGSTFPKDIENEGLERELEKNMGEEWTTKPFSHKVKESIAKKERKIKLNQGRLSMQ